MPGSGRATRLDTWNREAQVVPSAVAEAFDKLAPHWDRDHGPRSARRWAFALRARLLRDLLLRRKGQRVLDVGCGTGQYLLAVADVLDASLGIDISPEMIREARRNFGTAGDPHRFATQSIEGLKADEVGSFDLVLFYGSLEHLAQPAGAIACATRLLRPDGLMLISMVDPGHPRRLLVSRAFEEGRMPPGRLLDPRLVTNWAGQSGCVPVGVRSRMQSSTSVAASLCWLAAAFKSLLTGSRILVFRRRLER